MKGPISYLLLLYVSSIFLAFSISSSSTDLDVLMKLKAAMVAPEGTGLKDWIFSPSQASHCSFSGVVCDEASRVTSLNVSFVHLFGTIAPEIGLLNKLVNLTLSCSNLTGTLPLEVGKLTSLKLLNVSNNKLTGKFPGNIASGLLELEILDLYNNNFTGSLPTELVQLKRLKHLQLGGNFFSGEIPAIYSEIQSLEYLGLNANGLSGRFPASLARLPNLQELYVGYYNTYEGGIPPELGSLSSLRVLDMSSCNLHGEIPETLGSLKKLHTLFLQLNRLSGEIPAALSGLVSMKSLDLSNNELTGEIPKSFSEMNQLKLLDLFGNHLHGRIPAFIADLPNLEVLQVWENNFTFELPENLGRNGKLMILDVAKNHLTGRIPHSLCFGGRLHTLILMGNYFFGLLPQELGECKSLKRVRLMKNFFNGTIPTGFFNLPSIDMLELNDNYLTGELPLVISGVNLTLLTLSNNWLTGRIPAAIRNLTKLEKLFLESNRFSGEIPEEIFDLKKLSQINISANQISGNIPTSLARCSSLTSIDFSRNNLQGQIPTEITSLEILSTLNLSRNQLTGQIPAEIGSMTSLTTLDVSYNNLSGSFPSSGQFLVFKNSFFSGNPDLCQARDLTCLSMQNTRQVSSRKPSSSLNYSKLIITIISFVGAILLFVFAVKKTRGYWKRHMKSRDWKLTKFQRLDFKVEDVLECLKEENIIGKGGAGIVYRGSMPHGDDVAIKRLVGRSSGRSDHGFSAEIQTLGKIRHRNIVRLLGFVSNKDTNLLLYEYMPNGSLGELLHGSKGSHLQWETRMPERQNVCLPLLARTVTSRQFGDGVDIVRWVRKITSEMLEPSDMASVLEVVDPRLSGYPLSGVINLYKVAMQCVEDHSARRPTMREVVHKLTNPPQTSLIFEERR
ncbi:hypothetical protein HHK36_031194 [Tetracentron sinense]|uniref:non-specific serine/threonine protein kinase n=1 Tax=Tetracentron sinense TaxID=13715 RepID=A0A834YAU2_TETSI|nr:hypothetical protein HHK36_031194 [Tetracentron sinense]